MARLRRSSLPLLFLLLQVASSLKEVRTIHNRGDDGKAIHFESKQYPRERRKANTRRRLSKRQSVWYHGDYYDSSYSSSSSDSSSSSKSYTHDGPVVLLFPAKPGGHDGLSSGDGPETDSPSRQPTIAPTETSNVPTQSISESPTIRASSVPSTAPSIASSTSPSTVASEIPTTITSGQPTFSIGPSISPSVLSSAIPTLAFSSSPSAVDSDGPTSSPAPSTSPSALPSTTLSASPSGLDSDQPTLSFIPSMRPSISFSPSIALSAIPTVVSSELPSASSGPTLLPTRTLSDTPSDIPSDVPSQVPSFIPSMQPSTPAPFETGPPSESRVSQTIPVFTLEYQLFDFENPTETDLVELESLTRSYLRDYVTGAISDNMVFLDDFFTIYTEQEPDSGSLVVLVSFESTAFYDVDSPTTPAVSDIVEEIENAFTGEDLEGYLGMVQALPNSNLFAGTIDVFLINRRESENQSSAAAVPIVAGSATFLLSAFGLFAYRRRKRKSRLEASKEFLDILARDSSTECSTNETSSERNDMESGKGDHCHRDMDVWDRYKSPECLGFDETAILGEPRPLPPRSESKPMSIMPELRQRLTSQWVAEEPAVPKQSTKMGLEMEAGEVERAFSSATSFPKTAPSQKMQMMEELNDALEVRKSRKRGKSSRSKERSFRKDKISSSSQPLSSKDLKGNLMAELTEKISSRK